MDLIAEIHFQVTLNGENVSLGSLRKAKRELINEETAKCQQKDFFFFTLTF